MESVEQLASMAAKSPSGLAELLRRTASLRRRMAASALKSAPVDPVIAAEDIAQEVALRTLLSIHTYDPKLGTFEAWLAGMTRHIVADHRRRWAQRRVFQRTGNPYLLHRSAHQEARVALVRALSSPLLSSHDRLLLGMVATGHTANDIAEALGISSSAAAKRTQRLRVRLVPDESGERPASDTYLPKMSKN